MTNTRSEALSYDTDIKQNLGFASLSAKPRRRDSLVNQDLRRPAETWNKDVRANFQPDLEYAVYPVKASAPVSITSDLSSPITPAQTMR
jgi:hypothetical protein